MTKSLLLTYVLWLTGGWFGAHHFYLGRDRHAFVWWMTLGGYFGIGWLRDLWRIPEYVKLANRDPAATEQLKEKIQRNAKPVSSTARSVGQMVVSDALGYMVLYALPLDVIPESLLPLAAIPVPLAVAVGVHLVGNIGEQEGDLKMALLGAYLTYPLYFWSTHSVFWSSLASSYMFNHHSKRWRLVPRPQRSLRWRLLVLAACCLLYGSLWASWLYFNCSVTDSDGTQVKCRHSLRHFFGSPLWRDFKNVAHELYTHLRHHGWRELWRLLVDALDPQGEASALKVLGLPASATQEEITNAYRKLSRRWHPDRFHEPLQKQEAQETFIEIQKAYETLSSLKSRRLKKNIVERENPNAPRVEF
ncbi:dnaJ homolog subfamily C member 22 [Ixodes scapularis]|uniref:DnaJ homolog subfamily C member 22 n=1 Tax=Ixodes scapularis TaxID=6945 RepID=A0A4D5RRQ4_IXOSC|nr:dnaJ homolog subfamily C member 22 [Ixodes scapularis]